MSRAGLLTFDFSVYVIARPMLDPRSTVKLAPDVRVVVGCYQRYRLADKSQSFILLKENLVQGSLFQSSSGTGLH